MGVHSAYVWNYPDHRRLTIDYEYVKSLQYRIADQVLTVSDDSEKTLGLVHRYDAFLNLLCDGKFAFQRQAIEDKVVKKPNYKEEETLRKHSWDVTWNIHKKNREDYGAAVKPITIVVTESIATCVEVWNELVQYLMKKTPWNLNYANYDPERLFSRLLIESAELLESFVRMPDRGSHSPTRRKIVSSLPLTVFPPQRVQPSSGNKQRRTNNAQRRSVKTPLTMRMSAPRLRWSWGWACPIRGSRSQ